MLYHPGIFVSASETGQVNQPGRRKFFCIEALTGVEPAALMRLVGGVQAEVLAVGDRIVRHALVTLGREGLVISVVVVVVQSGQRPTAREGSVSLHYPAPPVGVTAGNLIEVGGEREGGSTEEGGGGGARKLHRGLMMGEG